MLATLGEKNCTTQKLRLEMFFSYFATKGLGKIKHTHSTNLTIDTVKI